MALSLIIALGLALAGFTVLFFIVICIFQALAGEPRAFAEKLKFKSRERAQREIDLLLEKENYPQALAVIRNSFYFDPVRYDPYLIEKIGNHHQSLLSRLLIIAERYGHHINNIAVLEDLFLSRSEMIRSYIEACASRQTLLKKRVPDWALEEYQNKIREIEDRLTTNRQSLRSQLDQVFKLLGEAKSTQPDEVTYH